MKNFFIKFKDIILYFVKGIAIGIAMIVPGVSGGTLALMMGIYKDIIDSINGLFKHFGKSMKVLIPVILGLLVGFLALVTPIKYGLEKWPLVVITLFAGLIIGGIPTLYRKVHGHESPKGFILTLLAIGFMVGTCFLVSSTTFTTDQLLNELNVGLWFYLLLAGLIISMALVMPGISGSMMLMVMGLYMSILTIIKSVMHGENIVPSLLCIIPIAIGVIIGFFLISFIMGKLLKHHEVGTYFVIIGLVIGSLGTIYYLNFDSISATWTPVHIVIAVVLFVVGFGLSFGLDLYVRKLQEKKANENEEVTPNEIR